MNNKNFFKKVLVIFILVFTTFISTACAIPDFPNEDNSGYTPNPPSQGSNGGSTTPPDNKNTTFY